MNDVVSLSSGRLLVFRRSTPRLPRCTYIAIPARFGPIQNQPSLAGVRTCESGECQSFDTWWRMGVAIRPDRYFALRVCRQVFAPMRIVAHVGHLTAAVYPA